MSNELTSKQKTELKKQGRLNPRDESQRDYVEPGSHAHMALLGLEPCEKTEDHPYEYRLADLTMFGPAATKEFLTRVLESKIAQLQSLPPEIQSEDRFAPGYMPPLWEPKE